MTDDGWASLLPPIGSFDQIVVLEQVASTQDEARRRAEATPRLAVIAHRQVEGRGRQGRVWDDLRGHALSMSMVVRSSLPSAGLSLAVGLGVVDACQALGAGGLGLKWPNDVVEDASSGRGRKLAGVLIERANGLAVVGVGLNVGQGDEDWPEDLSSRAVSLRQMGVAVERSQAARAVLECVSNWHDADSGAILRRWADVGTLRGRHCQFRVEGRLVTGVVVDLDQQWRLVLESAGGNRVRIEAAHAHLEQVGESGSLARSDG